MLVPEWESHSRDSHIVEPVIVFLEKQYDYKVKKTNFLFILFKLLWYRPDILLMANAIGSDDNVKWCHFAKMLGIKTIVLSSEGLWLPYVPNKHITQKQYADTWIWGNNFNHEVVVDLELKWNRNSYLQLLPFFPESKRWNVKCSGATGFDRYQLLEYEGKTHFLKRYNKSYDFVVLICGYAFYSLGELYLDDALKAANQALQLRKIYSQLISDHPDILFILKNHPGEVYRVGSKWDEFCGLTEKYSNVIQFCKEEDITDLLNVADFLISFDSTTAMEGWLLGKTSVMINPFDFLYPRSSIYKGNPIATNIKELNGLLNEFVETGKVCTFEDLREERQAVIKENISFSDGANFIRASKLIYDEMKAPFHAIKRLSIKEGVREGCFEVVQLLALVIYTITRQKQRYIYQRCHSLNRKEEEAFTKKYSDAISEYVFNNKELINNILSDYSGIINVTPQP